MTMMKFTASVAGIGLLLASGAALAETKVGADVSVNAGYATNPYGATGRGDTGSGTLSGSFMPSVVMTSPTGSTTLSGEVTHTEYTNRYSATTDFGVAGSTSQQLSSLTALTASAGFRSFMHNSLYPIYDPIVGVPTDPGAPIIVDPSGATSFAQRTETLYGSLGLSTSLSSRDSVSATGRISDVRYPNGALASNRAYTSYGGGLSYQRLVGRDTSLGLGVDVGRVNYRGGRLGDSTQISPSILYSTKLAPRITLNLSGGVTFNESKVVGGSINNTLFAGSASLCNQGDRSNLCARLSRSVSPTSFSGTSKVTAFGLTHSYKIDPRSRINTNISYSRANSIGNLGRTTDYGTAGIGYSRDVGPRLSATLRASYSDTFSSSYSRGSNFYGAVGLTYRMGNR